MNIEKKTAAEIAEFETATGWSWADVVDESLARERETLLASKNDEEKAEFMRETTWSWEDAVDEYLTAKREELLTAADENDDVIVETDEERFERERR